MKKWALALLVSFSLLGCAQPDRSKKDCLVQAVGFVDAMRVHDTLKYRWRRVLVMYWEGVKVGHAVAVYDSQRGIIAKDEEKGSWTLTMDRKLKDNPRVLAELYSPNTSVREAYFFEDEPVAQESPKEAPR